jgi:hypothetical protein
MCKTLLAWVLACLALGSLRAEPIAIVIASNAAPRVEFSAAKIVGALQSVQQASVVVRSADGPGRKIRLVLHQDSALGREGFHLATVSDQETVITAGDDSGLLYGGMELAERIRAAGRLPAQLDVRDQPAMRLRGTCVGLQKTYILPGRHVYEYPYTPELFPWFYDKNLWQQYLDFLVANHMNTLYLWSGHPFASLVRLPDYPYAVEVPDEVFQTNQAQFRWLAQECDRRGIWLVQMFYNIIVSKPFAETNGIATQSAVPTPLTEDYTRKSIAEFVRQYPHVGLMVCLGEALRDTPNQLEWCTNVILPGVLDGMRLAGLKEQPPVVIRTHAMDPYAIMPAAYQVYSNLFTESKYNGESLTTWEPRGKDQEIHLAMAKLGPHLVNIHILSNLEPFRYGDTEFIKRCVQASRDRLGATGLHLYPLSYWNWPYSPDQTAVPLLQWQRDWIWFTAWARYAWNPDVPEPEDHAYWIARLADCYGNPAAAEKIWQAYGAAGEIAPRLIRRFGITEGNRQTLSLGMTLDQLVKPDKYGAIEDLWLSQAPPGERLDEYVKREWQQQPHVGETPESIICDVLQEASNAVLAAEAAAPLVTKNQDEFQRLRNDTHCLQAMAASYSAKVRAAERVLHYGYSHDLQDMRQAESFLADSLASYEKLAALTENTYRYANSMQTSQRKIPVSGGNKFGGTNYLWSQLVPLYRQELADFQKKVGNLEHAPAVAAPALSVSANGGPAAAWPSAAFKLISTNAETYPVAVGAKVFTDRDFVIQSLSPALQGLTGIRFSHEAAKRGLPPLEFDVAEPVLVLVGYFDSPQKAWLQVPKLEFAAQADERGGVDTVLEQAAAISSCPGVNLHAFRFEPGRQKLELIGKGSFVILGVVPQSVKMK